jgi:hypothetical protein
LTPTTSQNKVDAMQSGNSGYSFGSKCIAALLCAGLLNLPAMATGDKALGMVAEAEHAHLDGVSAVSGATIYAGDAVDTENPGVLRLRLGTGQLYFTGASAATLSEHSGVAAAKLVRGTASFSVPDSTRFELETPAGVLRGPGKNATRGQVTITSPNELIVWAVRGDLILDNDGELHTIAEGKTFRIVIQDEQNSQDQDNTPPKNTRHRRRRLLFFLLFGSGLVAISAAFWIHQSESQSDP